MDEVDLAYLAGVFDGEGTILIQREPRTKHQNGSVEIRVEMTERLVVDEFEAAFGGTINTITRPKTPSQKDSYKWAAFGRNAVDALQAMYPHFRSPHSKARTAIVSRYQDIKETWKGRSHKKLKTDARQEAMAHLRWELAQHNRRGRRTA